MDDGLPIVIDNGSSTIKVGFAENKEEPDFRTFPSIVGSRINQKDSYVGYEAQSLRGLLTLNHPIERGIITNWDDMEEIWHHAFNKELRVTPEGRTVLLTEATSNPKANREEMTEIMIEKFQTSSIGVGNQARLSLIASGRLDGIVLESGYGVSHITGCHGNNALSNVNFCLNLAGGDLTDYLTNALSMKNFSFTRALVEDIKKTSCYVALDYEQELSINPRKSYKLPDGKILELANETYRCPEILFKPSLLHEHTYGIHALVFKSIMSCDAAIRKDLFENIVLSGGNMMYPGMVERMQKEMVVLVSPALKVIPKVTLCPDSDSSAWIGGSIIADVAVGEQLWVSKREYEESGSWIVHSRCF